MLSVCSCCCIQAPPAPPTHLMPSQMCTVTRGSVKPTAMPGKNLRATSGTSPSISAMWISCDSSSPISTCRQGCQDFRTSRTVAISLPTKTHTHAWSDAGDSHALLVAPSDHSHSAVVMAHLGCVLCTGGVCHALGCRARAHRQARVPRQLTQHPPITTSNHQGTLGWRLQQPTAPGMQQRQHRMFQPAMAQPAQVVPTCCDTSISMVCARARSAAGLADDPVSRSPPVLALLTGTHLECAHG